MNTWNNKREIVISLYSYNSRFSKAQINSTYLNVNEKVKNSSMFWVEVKLTLIN